MQKVVVVEKIKTIREGIKIFLDRFSNFECVASYSDFETFRDELSTTLPDIVLIDQNHKTIPVLEEISNLKKEYPNIIVVMLTMNEENDHLFDTILNGASGYINKNAPSQRLIKVLEDVSNRMVLINSLIARKIISHISNNKLQNRFNPVELLLLSNIVEGNNLLAMERSLKMSSDEIKLSFYTILSKLYEHSNSEITRM